MRCKTALYETLVQPAVTASAGPTTSKAAHQLCRLLVTTPGAPAVSCPRAAQPKPGTAAPSSTRRGVLASMRFHMNRYGVLSPASITSIPTSFLIFPLFCFKTGVSCLAPDVIRRFSLSLCVIEFLSNFGAPWSCHGPRALGTKHRNFLMCKSSCVAYL